MEENVLLIKSKELAIDIINLCKDIIEKHRDSILTKQLIRSGTSIGANIHEANYGYSKADFIAKLEISLKECYETEYWLDILYETNYMDKEIYLMVHNKCGVIRKLLIASCLTTKKNNKRLL